MWPTNNTEHRAVPPRALCDVGPVYPPHFPPRNARLDLKHFEEAKGCNWFPNVRIRTMAEAAGTGALLHYPFSPCLKLQLFLQVEPNTMYLWPVAGM